MKVILREYIGSHRLAKLTEWMKLVSYTGAVQILVQICSFVSGILVIRLLPQNEYALYTIANTMLGTFNLLTDGGITTGVMAQGGKVWQDKVQLGKVLITGFGLRRKVAVFGMIIGVPVLIFMINMLEASWFTTIMIVASFIPAFYTTMVNSLLEIVPKLHQNVIPLQKNQLYVAIGRLILSSMTLFFFPFTAVALIAASVPRYFGNNKLKKIVAEHADVEQVVDKEIQKDILKVFKRVLPGAIYFCLSGQVTIWLISFFGETKDVASLGAIGRLTIVLSIFNPLMATLIVPRFARLADTEKLKLYFWRIYFSVAAVIFFMVFGIWLFSDYILMILGEKYAGLSAEMTLSILAAGISMLGGGSYSLASSRGWLVSPTLTIVLNIMALATGIWLFDMGTLIGVLKLDILVAVNFALLHSSYCIYRLYRKQ